MFDQRLIRKINQGRCFALVGSGPSTEAGYPSWAKLAKVAFEGLKRGGRITDEASYEKYLKNNQYPELFSQIERDLGSRGALVELIRSLMISEAGGSYHIYDLLANWPFACYLTTNWDDLIDLRLRRIPESFSTIQNSKEDFAAIRHDASHLIVKLHSDLSHADRAVITSADYARLMSSEYKYFRDRLKSIFEMFDILIVGHSLSDPDLRFILQVAKETPALNTRFS